MIILFFIISMFVLAGGLAWVKKDEWNIAALVMAIAGGVMVLISFMIGGCVVNDAVSGRYIDQKIAMYQEENKSIESDINIVVKDYMKHEDKTFDMSRIKSTTVLVQMYPELKSNELVAKQIDIYYKNNKKIKQLKEDKIDYEKSKFLLYFGGRNSGNKR